MSQSLVHRLPSLGRVGIQTYVVSWLRVEWGWGGQGRDDSGDNLGEVPAVHQACAECITGVTSHSHAVTNRDYCARFSE